MTRVLIILPTYDEAENIRAIIPQLRDIVPEANILVVDDGSPDGTADIALLIGKDLGNVEVLRRPGKDGLGSAYREAMKWALDKGYDVLVQMDADLSHDPHQLPQLLAALDEEVELVIGSRYVPGGSIPDWPVRRRLLSKYGNVYVRLVLGLKIHDATTGYRVWRSQSIRTIGVTETTADGYGFMIESNYDATRAGLRIVEVPIHFRDRTFGKSKMSGRIIVEALTLVSWWGIRDRVLRRNRPRDGSAAHA